MTSKADFDAKTEGSEVVKTFASSINGKIGSPHHWCRPEWPGAEMAAALATQEPKLLILTGRSPSKVEEVIRTITAKCPTVKTRILELDLASIASISSAADQVHSYAEPAIDIVINNAGVMNIPERSLSVDGFEMQLAVNYLGLALFTNSIMPKLLNSSAGRVVNIVSNGYALSPFRFSDYNFEGKDLPVEEQPSKEICSAYGLPWGLGYLPAVAYGQSKTASILYTTELAARLKDKSVSVICLHPGAIATDIWRQMPKEVVEVILKQLPMKSASQGTATPLVAALDPKLAESSGVYLNDCQVEDVEPWAKDPKQAQRLWALTEELLGKKWFW